MVCRFYPSRPVEARPSRRRRRSRFSLSYPTTPAPAAAPALADGRPSQSLPPVTDSSSDKHAEREFLARLAVNEQI